MKIFVPERGYGTFKNGIVVNEEESEYVEYFDYVRQWLHLETTASWKDAFNVYQRILDTARDEN